MKASVFEDLFLAECDVEIIFLHGQGSPYHDAPEEFMEAWVSRETGKAFVKLEEFLHAFDGEVPMSWAWALENPVDNAYLVFPPHDFEYAEWILMD